MKVRCIRLNDSRGLPAERSSWMKVGRIYQVLSLSVEPSGTMVRMVGDEPTPALFELDLFEIVSSLIPPNWVVVSDQPGHLLFGPLSWSVVGFWERFFDGEEAAIACFESERLRIVEGELGE